MLQKHSEKWVDLGRQEPYTYLGVVLLGIMRERSRMPSQTGWSVKNIAQVPNPFIVPSILSAWLGKKLHMQWHNYAFVICKTRIAFSSLIPLDIPDFIGFLSKISEYAHSVKQPQHPQSYLRRTPTICALIWGSGLLRMALRKRLQIIVEHFTFDNSSIIEVCLQLQGLGPAFLASACAHDE